MSARCTNCDRPLATEADGKAAERHRHGGGCECEVCMALCWGEWIGGCAHEPHDWRAEALRYRAFLRKLKDADRATWEAWNDLADEAAALLVEESPEPPSTIVRIGDTCYPKGPRGLE